MIGGYFSFSGIGNQARYGMTPLAEVLPVSMLNWDDRIECPEGAFALPRVPSEHPLFSGINLDECPPFSGYNKTILKEGATLFAAFNDDPFLAGWQVGKGRTFAFTSDCAPDWASLEVLRWKDYPYLMANIVRWTASHLE